MFFLLSNIDMSSKNPILHLPIFLIFWVLWDPMRASTGCPIQNPKSAEEPGQVLTDCLQFDTAAAIQIL